MRHDPKIVAGLLAAAATVVVMLPMRGLFDTSPWLVPSVLGVVVVAASGMVLRALTQRAGLIILGQALVGASYLLVTQLGETTRLLVLPTPRTITTLVAHLEQAQDTITTYAAPAPATPGIVVALVIIVVVVDHELLVDDDERRHLAGRVMEGVVVGLEGICQVLVGSDNGRVVLAPTLGRCLEVALEGGDQLVECGARVAHGPDATALGPQWH
jgi:hypothetical protein